MKSLGLIGGTAWRSTARYYVLINEGVNAHFGDNTNPPLVIANTDHAEVQRCQLRDDWEGVAAALARAGERLRGAGVDRAMFCANTPHRVLDRVADRIGLPFLHIGDALGRALAAQGLERVGFIGTRFSMEGTFVTGRIETAGVKVAVPRDPAVLDEMQRIVRRELAVGRFLESSRDFMRGVLAGLVEDGAEGVVLGCTEFPLLFAEADPGVRTFDSLDLHARAAVDFILS